MLFTTLCTGWILKKTNINIAVSQKYQKSKVGETNCIPESCVMLFTTLCTGWILKKRNITIFVAQQRQKSENWETGKHAVYSPP